MTDYRSMYTMLFNCITDAVNALEKNDALGAKAILINAQIRAEDMYIDDDTPEG